MHPPALQTAIEVADVGDADSHRGGTLFRGEVELVQPKHGVGGEVRLERCEKAPRLLLEDELPFEVVVRADLSLVDPAGVVIGAALENRNLRAASEDFFNVVVDQAVDRGTEKFE